MLHCYQALKNEKNYNLIAQSNDSGTSLWPLVLVVRNFCSSTAKTSALTLIKWNLDITKDQGIG